MKADAQTKECEACGERVVCPKGFVIFNLNDHKGNHCPACHELVEPTTCSFTNCLWMFEGRKVLPHHSNRSAPDVVGPWRVAKNRDEYFDDKDNVVEWASLVLMPSPARLKNQEFVQAILKDHRLEAQSEWTSRVPYALVSRMR